MLKKILVSLKKIIEGVVFLMTLIAGAAGVCGTIFLAANRWFSFFSVQVETTFLIIVAALSLVLIAVGFERWKQREETEKKIQKLSEDFENLQTAYLQIPFYEVIEGRTNIMEETINEINNAGKNIRATSFKREENEDTPEHFYTALGLLLRRKKHTLVYETCFNEGNNLLERKKAFEALKLTDEELDRMIYYRFEKQSYFNLLIIDDNAVFIGFPLHVNDRHMQIALKIKAENNKATKNFIQNLIRWYDNILKKDGTPVDVKELLRD